jgi:predicted metal-dependent phosphoesterase TrpH
VNKQLRIEFHCHTRFSEDSLTTPNQLVETCLHKGLDRVVVTDHNTLEGAREAQILAPELVIIGEEVMTTCGELLAAFVSEPVPGGLEPEEALDRLQDQGAFISVSHPFDRFRSPWGWEKLLRILARIDAIEVFNARCLWPGFNWSAKRFAHHQHLPGTAGSDAHTPAELGRAIMLMEAFDDAGGMRKAISGARLHNHLSSPLVHFASHQAAQIKRRQD